MSLREVLGVELAGNCGFPRVYGGGAFPVAGVEGMVVLGRVIEGIAGRTPRVGCGNDERASGARHEFAAGWPEAVSVREGAESEGGAFRPLRRTTIEREPHSQNLWVTSDSGGCLQKNPLAHSMLRALLEPSAVLAFFARHK